MWVWCIADVIILVARTDHNFTFVILVLRVSLSFLNHALQISFLRLVQVHTYTTAQRCERVAAHDDDAKT